MTDGGPSQFTVNKFCDGQIFSDGYCDGLIGIVTEIVTEKSVTISNALWERMTFLNIVMDIATGLSIIVTEFCHNLVL